MQRTHVHRECDIDGDTEEVQEVPFAVGGRAYVVDLCSACKAGFDQTMQAYVAGAAKSAHTRSLPPGRKRRSTPSRVAPGIVRAWALKNNIEGVSARGRVSRALEDKYLAAQG
jgi:hypothetical protein